MSTAAIIGVLLWFVLMLAASTIGIACLFRKGVRGLPWAALAVAGAGLSIPLFFAPARAWTQNAHWIGIGGLVAVPIACLGLIVRAPSPHRCPSCKYDFRGVTGDSGARCPECGAARPGMEGRCLSCKADIRSALAGGTIKCPFCGAPIDGDGAAR